VKEGIAWFTANPHPDIVFMDIRLIDGISFEILENVKINAALIFCTAYEEYAVKAFKVNGLNYILKPLAEEEIRKSLIRFNETKSIKITQQEVKEFLIQVRKGNTYRKYFLVNSGKTFYNINTDDIDYFYTKERIHFLVLKSNKRYMIDMYLDDVQKDVDPTFFFRVNRQYLISITAIQKLIFEYGRYYIICNTCTNRIIVSKHKTTIFKQWLNQ